MSLLIRSDDQTVILEVLKLEQNSLETAATRAGFRRKRF
jgi:hypothetical protein